MVIPLPRVRIHAVPPDDGNGPIHVVKAARDPIRIDADLQRAHLGNNDVLVGFNSFFPCF